MVGVEQVTIAEDEYVNSVDGYELGDVYVGRNSVLEMSAGHGGIGTIEFAESYSSWLGISSLDPNAFITIYEGQKHDGELWEGHLDITIKAANLEEGLPTLVTREKFPADTIRFYLTEWHTDGTTTETEYFVGREKGDSNQYLYKPFATQDYKVTFGYADSYSMFCTFEEAIDFAENGDYYNYTIEYVGDEEVVCIKDDVIFTLSSSNSNIKFDGATFRFEGNVSFTDPGEHSIVSVEFLDGVEFVGGSLKGTKFLDNGLEEYMISSSIYARNKAAVFENCDISDVEIQCHDNASLTIDGCDVSNCIVYATDDVKILDTKNVKPDMHFKGIATNGSEITFNTINTIYIDMLGNGEIFNFDSGKVEIKNLGCGELDEETQPVFNIKSADIVSIDDVNVWGEGKILIRTESATPDQKIMSASYDCSGIFTTEATDENGTPLTITYRDGAIVYDYAPLFKVVGIGSYSEWDDVLAYINQKGSSDREFNITLLGDVTIDELVLPTATKAKSITFNGEYSLTILNETFTVPTNTYFNCELVADDTAFIVPAGKTLGISNGTVKSITGTSTSNLVAGNLYVTDGVKTFASANATEKLTIGGDMTGIKNFGGILEFINPESVVNISNIASDATFLYNTGDVLPDVTVNAADTDAVITININDYAPVENGTVIMNASSNITRRMVVRNMSTDSSYLGAYYYISEKVVKLECHTVYVETFLEDEPVHDENKMMEFPSVEIALQAIEYDGNSDIDYIVNFNSATLDKLTIPTNAKSIKLNGEIEYTGETLVVPANTVFERGLIAPDTAITVSAGKKLEIATGEVKSIKGTSTSELRCNEVVIGDVTTFGTFESNKNVLNGDMTGIDNFAGNILVNSDSSVVNVKNIKGSWDWDIELQNAIKLVLTSEYGMIPEDVVLPKVTVASFDDDAMLLINVDFIHDREFVNTNYDVEYGIDIETGTTILYTTGEDLSDHILINNKTSSGKDLAAYYYPATKSIKAECPDAITLSYGDVENNLPNIDKALEIINANKDNTIDYTIDFNTPVTLDKLTIPTYANSITFTGEDMTYEGTTLKLPVTTTFTCDLMAGSTAITASKDVTFRNAVVKSVTGTSSSEMTITGNTRMVTAKTFRSVDATEGEAVVIDDMIVTDFSGNITTDRSDTNVKITNPANARIRLIADENGKFGKVTLNTIPDDSVINIEVTDYFGNKVYLESGTTVLYLGGNYIGGVINVSNVTSNSTPLTPFYYSKDKSIRAEWEGAFKLAYGDVEKNLPNIDKVFEEINANEDKTIDYTIWCFSSDTPEVTFDKLTIPTYANSITFTGSDIIFTGKTLKLPVDTKFDCNFIAENTAITASKDVYISDATVKSLTGTRNSKLVAGKLIADSVKTFATVSGDIDVTSSMAVTGFAGRVKVNTPKTTVSIANVTESSDIRLVSDESGKFGKVTITDVAEDVTATVSVVDAEGNAVALESGTIVLYTAGKDLSGAVDIFNKTSDEKPLTAFYYSKDKSIKAEWEGAMTLSYGVVEKKLPNIDKVFEEINANKDKTIDYTIQFNRPVEFDKLTIPTYANSIEFTGSEMTFTGKTLKLPVDTYFGCRLIAENTAITASKNVTIGESNIKSITGTKNSVLTIYNYVCVGSVKTFGNVVSNGVGTLFVDGTMSGISNFSGELYATSDSTLTITNVNDLTYIGLYSDAEGEFARVTVNGVTEEKIMLEILDENRNSVDLSSGTVVMYSSKDISENIIIKNKTDDEKDLAPFYYPKTKTIKAEWAEAMTLSYGDTNVNLPNIDKAFEVITANKDKTVDYTIQFNRPVEFDKLTIPTYANSIKFTGSEMTFTGKTLKLPVTTTFACDLTAENTAITASKDVTFRDATVKSITGTSKSSLTVEGTLDAQTVKTFADVDATEGKIVADTNVTVTGFAGYLVAGTAKTVVTITTATDDSEIDLVSDEDEKFGKATVNNVAEDALVTVTVVDEEGYNIALPSNIPVLYSSSDISESVLIFNSTEDADGLHPYYVKAKKAIYAGYNEAVEARYVDANEELQTKYFTNLEEALAFISADSLYARINIDSDVRVEKLSIPKYENGVEIYGNGYSILLDNITSVSSAGHVAFYNVCMDSTKPFKITASDYTTFSCFGSSTLTAVSGKSTKGVIYSGVNDINYNVSGFGSIHFYNFDDACWNTISGSINVKNVFYEEGAFLQIVPGANVKFTDVYYEATEEFEPGEELPLTIRYCQGEGTASPVTISGDVYGKIFLEHQGRFKSGEQLLVASKVSLSKFTLNENSFPDEKDYILTRKSGKVYIKPIVLDVFDGTYAFWFAEWSDFVDMVNSRKEPERVYSIKLRDDFDIGGAFTMPKAGYYQKIEFFHDNETPYTITFTGGIKQTGEMKFEDVNLRSLNSKGIETAYTFTTGNYYLSAVGVDFGKITSLTSTSTAGTMLYDCELEGKFTAVNGFVDYSSVTGAVKTSELLGISGNSEFGNTVNAYGIITMDGDCSITLKNGKLLTIGNGGSGEDIITINLESPITEKTKVGTVPLGYYNDNFVGGNVDIVVEGTTIYAYPKA